MDFERIIKTGGTDIRENYGKVYPKYVLGGKGE